MDIDLSRYKFEFNSANGIMFKYYFGGISFEDIVNSWEYAIENNLIPKETKGFIIDFTNATLISPVSKHYILADFYRNHPDIFHHHKIAIITINPKEVVVPILLRQQDFGSITMPFSTLEGAIDWILH